MHIMAMAPAPGMGMGMPGMVAPGPEVNTGATQETMGGKKPNSPGLPPKQTDVQEPPIPGGIM